jgi:trehalose/maltose hydrolase-like predicted phosphorylase
VTGPDEYSTVVDNNLYTNLMAAENLSTAADSVDRLRADSPRDYQRLVESTGLHDQEIAEWRRAASHIHIPRDPQAGVHLQDDHFLEQAPWDFAGTPADRYPLLLHYHPLVIYRHQVIKQADVVLATVLLADHFTAAERSRIFRYYDPLTTGDSSLSECIQAIAAADAGKYRTAEEYLVDAAAVDIADTAGNLRDGIHVASAGGAWLALVCGFAGYRWRTHELRPHAAHPRPPTTDSAAPARIPARHRHPTAAGHLLVAEREPGHRRAPRHPVHRHHRVTGRLPRRLPHPRLATMSNPERVLTWRTSGASSGSCCGACASWHT